MAHDDGELYGHCSAEPLLGLHRRPSKCESSGGACVAKLGAPNVATHRGDAPTARETHDLLIGHTIAKAVVTKPALRPCGVGSVPVGLRFGHRRGGASCRRFVLGGVHGEPRLYGSHAITILLACYFLVNFSARRGCLWSPSFAPISQTLSPGALTLYVARRTLLSRQNY